MNGWFGIGLVLAVGEIVLTTNAFVPTLVGVYVDCYGLTTSTAGYTAALYMAGAGLGAALVSVLLLSVRTDLLLAAGLGALAIGNFASIFAHSLIVILFIRMLAGLGEGVGFALMGAAISRMRRPTRVYAIFTVLVLLISAGLQYSVPWLRGHLGAQMLFAPIAAAPACLLIFCRSFPDLTANPESAPSDGVLLETARGFYFWSGILATLTAYGAYGASFAYLERIGVHSRLTSDAVARILGSGYLVSVGGALLALLTSRTHGRAWRLVISLLAVGCSVWVLVSGTALAYRLGVSALFFCWFYFAPNLLALMSLADASGRLAAAATGAMEWGLAIGPAIAALFLNAEGFAVVAAVGVAGYLAALLLLIPILRHVRSKHSGEPVR